MQKILIITTLLLASFVTMFADDKNVIMGKGSRALQYIEINLPVAPEERYIIAHGEWSENLRFERNEPWVVDDKLIISCGAAI